MLSDDALIIGKWSALSGLLSLLRARLPPAISNRAGKSKHGRFRSVPDPYSNFSTVQNQQTISPPPRVLSSLLPAPLLPEGIVFTALKGTGATSNSTGEKESNLRHPQLETNHGGTRSISSPTTPHHLRPLLKNSI